MIKLSEMKAERLAMKWTPVEDPMDVLIEIAEAALAWRDAEAGYAAVAELIAAAKNNDEYCAACTLAPPRARDRNAARGRLTALLAEVSL